MHFDKLAKTWDENPTKTERAQAFAQEITEFLSSNATTPHSTSASTAIEFGCGTGLLSFQLKDDFHHITLIDVSTGMIDVLSDKITTSGLSHFTPLKADIFTESTIIPQVDIIYTLMAMHHMHDTDKTLAAFHKQLNDNGYVCIADLVKEDGSFHHHVKGFDGHNGFDKHALSTALVRNGFTVEYYKEFYTINQERNGTIKKYPLFIMIGKKQ